MISAENKGLCPHSTKMNIVLKSPCDKLRVTEQRFPLKKSEAGRRAGPCPSGGRYRGLHRSIYSYVVKSPAGQARFFAVIFLGVQKDYNTALFILQKEVEALPGKTREGLEGGRGTSPCVAPEPDGGALESLTRSVRVWDYFIFFAAEVLKFFSVVAEGHALKQSYATCLVIRVCSFFRMRGMMLHNEKSDTGNNGNPMPLANR